MCVLHNAATACLTMRAATMAARDSHVASCSLHVHGKPAFRSNRQVPQQLPLPNVMQH
jgi:hypothetical protein